MHQVYLSLGSNLGDSLHILQSAVKTLRETEGILSVTPSSLYKTAPIGPKQPDFLNAALKIETTLSPLELLRKTQAIENAHDRERKEHWGPRTLDIDLILYEDKIINHPDLKIPHPEMHRRGFVLVPLYELNPRLKSPTHGSIEQLLTTIDHLDDVILIPQESASL